MTAIDQPLPDLPLLRKAVEWVEEQSARPRTDREWYQGGWRTPAAELARNCGTCYCVAGYVAEISGGEWLGSMYLLAEPGEAPHVDVVSADDRAQRLLGLIAAEAGYLFASGNRAVDVRGIAERIAARAGERL